MNVIRAFADELIKVAQLSGLTPMATPDVTTSWKQPGASGLGVKIPAPKPAAVKGAINLPSATSKVVGQKATGLVSKLSVPKIFSAVSKVR